LARIEVVSEDSRYITYSFEGRITRTEHGAPKEKILHAIADIEEAFTTEELREVTGVGLKELVNAIYALTMERIVIRTPKKIRTKTQKSSSWLYVTCNNEEIKELLFEEYLRTKLLAEGQEQVVQAYEEIKYSQVPISSVELTEKYKYLDERLLRSTFVNAGLIERKYFKRYNSAIYWGERVSRKMLPELLKAQEEKINKIRAKKVNRGREQQKTIFEAMKRATADGHLAIIFDDVKYEVKRPIEGSYIMIDTVAYGFLRYYDKRRGKWVKLGNQRKKFPLVVESKAVTAGANTVNERLPLLKKAFPDGFIFVIAAKDHYPNLFHQTYELNYYIPLVRRKLEEFLEAFQEEVGGGEEMLRPSSPLGAGDIADQSPCVDCPRRIKNLSEVAEGMNALLEKGFGKGGGRPFLRTDVEIEVDAARAEAGAIGRYIAQRKRGLEKYGVLRRKVRWRK